MEKKVVLRSAPIHIIVIFISEIDGHLIFVIGRGFRGRCDLSWCYSNGNRGHCWPSGYCGNSNIQVWETGDKSLIRKEVLRKLNAAKGGGFIFQSDHSVSSAVSGETYDYIVKLVREVGKYPLNLSEKDE